VAVQEQFHSVPFHANLGFWLALAIECPFEHTPPVGL